MIPACVAEITTGKANIEIYMKPVVVLNHNPATQTATSFRGVRPSGCEELLLPKSHLTRRMWKNVLRRMKALPQPAGYARGLTMETNAKKLAREGKWWYIWFADKR